MKIDDTRSHQVWQMLVAIKYIRRFEHMIISSSAGLIMMLCCLLTRILADAHDVCAGCVDFNLVYFDRTMS
jgi:hypothetical protein